MAVARKSPQWGTMRCRTKYLRSSPYTMRSASTPRARNQWSSLWTSPRSTTPPASRSWAAESRREPTKGTTRSSRKTWSTFMRQGSWILNFGKLFLLAYNFSTYCILNFRSHSSSLTRRGHTTPHWSTRVVRARSTMTRTATKLALRHWVAFGQESGAATTTVWLVNVRRWIFNKQGFF